MELKKIQNGNKITFEVTGTVDTETSGDLNKELLGLDYSDLDLTLDFKNTKYITSAGLRVILIARKKLSDDTMRIINVNESIAEVFDMTGFSEIVKYTKEEPLPAKELSLSFKSILKNKINEKIKKPVFSYLGREYTWLDIEKASQIIADDLSSVGVKKGSHVGICSPNSINWIFTFYAVQKLGGIAILLNFGLKASEVITLSKIGDINYLCYAELPKGESYAEYTEAVKSGDSRVKDTYDISSRVDFTQRFGEYELIKDKFPEQYHADDASIVIFTSGSTGLPKAVLSSAHNMLQCAVPMLDEFKFSENDKVCAFLPFFHVFGFVTCISMCALTDFISYIPESNSPARLMDIIENNKCTVFHSVPTMLLAMVQNKDFRPERVASLRCSALGGSATSEEQMNYLRKLFPNNHFANVYGMSENAAISVTRYEDSVRHITQTVGVPAKGVEIEIRDHESGKKMPDGESGEVCIRSENMIVCYYKLAVEKQPLDDEGWLATGDLGYIDGDGYLRLSGRVKDLIIRGGENISPNEVASAVSAIPSVADVKVIGVPHEIFGEEVAAAVILRDGAEFDEEKAKAFLSDKLAKFKIPEYFITVDKFPMLGSGKIDAITLKKDIMEKIKSKRKSVDIS